MSRRVSAVTVAAVLCLLAIAYGGPVLVTTAAAYGEHVFQANPIVGVGDPYYAVYSGQTTAQSIRVTQDYVLLNLTLRVKNDGNSTNALVVSIHPDDPIKHVPVLTTTLASTSQVSPNNHPFPDNWSFLFNPPTLLRAGTTYWIVAENAAPQAPPTNGYEWHESGAATYPTGSAYVMNTATGVWTRLADDLYFVTYGREWGSNVTVALSANPTQAQPGDSVTFTVALGNTGSQTARRVWVNATLPPGLENATATYPGIQPVSSAAFPNLTFVNVTNGPATILMSGQVAIGTPPGSLITARVAVSFENATGAIFHDLPAAASIAVGFATKQLYLGSTSVATKLLTTVAPSSAVPAVTSVNPGAPQPVQFIQTPVLADPFVASNVSVGLWVSTQKAPPETYKLNISLLDNGTPVLSLHPNFVLTVLGYQLVNFSFGTVNYTFADGHQIGLSIWSVGGGGGSSDNLLLRYNGTGYPSRLNLVTTTYVSIDDLALVNPIVVGGLWSPLDPIVVRANVSDPFGAGKITGAWINITSPSGQLVAAGAMRTLATDPSSVPAWILFNYTLSPPLTTGRHRVDVLAMEDNGVTDRARGFAAVVLPRFTFQDVSSAASPQAGGAFAYYVYYNNTGTGPARKVWINETLPVDVVFLSSNVTPSWAVGNRYGWNLTNVSPGSHVLEIDVLVPGSVTVQDWIQDNASLVFTDSSGHPGGVLAARATVFLNGPILVVSFSSAPASLIHGNETVVYVLSLLNQGTDSGVFWVNDTLPAGFRYIWDNASRLGGTLTRVGSVLMYEFPSIPHGVQESFRIVAAAGSSLTRNQTYVDTLSIAVTSSDGHLMPALVRTSSLLAVSPWFPMTTAAFQPAQTHPGQYTTAVVYLWNRGNEAAPWVWLNVSYDVRLTIVDAGQPFVAGPGIADFILQNVSIGATSLYLNLTVVVGAADGAQLPLGGTIDAHDGFDNWLPTQVVTPARLSVTAAALRLGANPVQPTVEAGTIFPLSISVSNAGSRNASGAWLNTTLPSALGYVSDTSGVNASVVGSTYSWHWAPPSDVLLQGDTFVFTLSLRARDATPSGTYANLTLHLDYADAGGLSLPGQSLAVHPLVVAPALSLSLEAMATSIVSGGTFNYSLRLVNRGLSMARHVYVWDVLDPSLRLVSYAASVQATGNSTLNWTFTDVAPGRVEVINLTVQTLDGLAPQTYIANSVEATYTNSLGAPLVSIRSLPVTVQIASDFSAFFWILGLSAVVGVAVAVLLLRRERVTIEEAFLVYRDGVLISHLSRTIMREKDEDVLSGMLTAVQEFVRDAFQYGERRDLHQLDFGDYRILIERGKFVYLAVVYSGEESPALRKKVRSVITLIERQFGDVLERWDGDMEEVMGARDLIRETLLGSTNHNHAENSIPQYE